MKMCRDGNNCVSIPVRGAFLFVLFICAIPGFAQQPAAVSQAESASVSGKLTAAAGQNTANHLSGITVQLTSTATGSPPQTTFTDSEGHYEFTHLAPGSYNVGGHSRRI